MNGRSLIGVLTSALFCCSVRSVGCGGGDSGAALGSVSPMRAVLAVLDEVSPRFEFDRVRSIARHAGRDDYRGQRLPSTGSDSASSVGLPKPF